ncbi:MAG: hypothetical protein OEZ65_17025, partial [Gemmatimonadota bacterium]|nr:hypothetical protein [Gemmatimonadota bacterium]
RVAPEGDRTSHLYRPIIPKGVVSQSDHPVSPRDHPVSQSDQGGLTIGPGVVSQSDPSTPVVTTPTSSPTTTRPEIPVSDMWEIWTEVLGGKGRQPALTDGRRKVLKLLWTEQLAAEDKPMNAFRKILKAVKRSEHHMSVRQYHLPESLFRNQERRDRWAQEVDRDRGTPGALERPRLTANTTIGIENQGEFDD